MKECETCIYYPPSSFGGKPCCMCDTSNPYMNCYSEYEELSVLRKHKDVLRVFDKDRIFSIYHSKNRGFYIEESCDNYFSHELTKKECLKLSEMFKDIASYISE
jgi:hypothetical protein